MKLTMILTIIGGLLMLSVASGNSSQPINNIIIQEGPFDFLGFACPLIYGKFPHPTDCSKYYECRFGWATLKYCSKNKYFDENSKKCVDKNKVKCGDHDVTETTAITEKTTESPKDFKCPYFWGSFANPFFCFRYYVCVFNVPKALMCGLRELFDENDKKCRSQEKVKCGSRLNRDQATSTVSLTPTQTSTVPTVTSSPIPKSKFKFFCPFLNGRYVDPEDCSQYYECKYFISTHNKCSRGKLYDERKEECIEDSKVKCGSRPGGVNDNSEDKPVELKCPYSWGTFSHPTDCSKYMVCIYNVPTVFVCKRFHLFHALYRRCSGSKKVKCNNRINPDDPITLPTVTNSVTESTVREISSTVESTTVTLPEASSSTESTTVTSSEESSSTVSTTMTLPESSTASTTVTLPEESTSTVSTTVTLPEESTSTVSTTATLPEESLSTESITVTSPEESTTTESITSTSTESTTVSEEPTETPPPHDCDDDDLDCIIDETGEISKWFKCPQRYGHFPHPSSIHLFLHCDNFRPFVKKCAEGTAFSREYLVCSWED